MSDAGKTYITLHHLNHAHSPLLTLVPIPHPRMSDSGKTYITLPVAPVRGIESIYLNKDNAWDAKVRLVAPLAACNIHNVHACVQCAHACM